MEDNNNNKKRYFVTIAGVRVEISKEKAEQIRRLQKLITDQRNKQQDTAKEVEFTSIPTAEQNN